MYNKQFVKFNDGDQKQFLNKVKERGFNSWEDVANFLGVNRSMVFFYLSEKSKLPYDSLIILADKANIDRSKLSFEIKSLPYYGKGKIPPNQF